jgi:hypothetical protein
MSTNFQEYLHTLKDLLLEICARDILALEGAICRIKLEWLDGFPYTMNLRWRKRYHLQGQSKQAVGGMRNLQFGYDHWNEKLTVPGSLSL